jgi:hypothetical protein
MVQHTSSARQQNNITENNHRTIWTEYLHLNRWLDPRCFSSSSSDYWVLHFGTTKSRRVIILAPIPYQATSSNPQTFTWIYCKVSLCFSSVAKIPMVKSHGDWLLRVLHSALASLVKSSFWLRSLAKLHHPIRRLLNEYNVKFHFFHFSVTKIPMVKSHGEACCWAIVLNLNRASAKLSDIWTQKKYKIKYEALHTFLKDWCNFGLFSIRNTSIHYTKLHRMERVSDRMPKGDRLSFSFTMMY